MSDKSKQSATFTPRPFGAVFQWVGQNSIKIIQGEFTDQIFKIRKTASEEQVHMNFFHNSVEIGHCYAELIKNSMITIWDVVVERPYQHKGLAEMMVKILAKELFAQQKSSQFQIRMLQLFKPHQAEIQLQNVGLGVIAFKLGLTCEYDINVFLTNNNINEFEVIAPTETIGPAYKINLNCYPYTMIAFLIDIEKEKPITNFDTYIKFRRSTELMLDLARHRALIIGNANYLLKENGIDDFISRVADSGNEAKLLSQKIEGIK